MTLRFENVSYRVGTKTLLDQVSFTVQPGEVVSIIGPNGAGKSTLLRLASGLNAPTQGRITLEGQNLAQMAPQHLATRRAMLAQDTPAEARFTVADVVGMSVHHLPAAAREALITEQLLRVGLFPLAQRDITSLSGGERQRAHLARVLAQLEAGAMNGTPGLLLLDEPISAQDLSRQEQIFTLARDHAQRGGTCLIVLHDLNWASACSDRIIALHTGRIYTQGATTDVLTAETLTNAFHLHRPTVRTHTATQRPFIIPHDHHHETRPSGDYSPCILP